MKRIFLPDHLKREILAMKWNVKGERRKVTIQTLINALNYTTKTKLADTLRAVAIQRGGVIYDSAAKPKDYVPNCISTIDQANLVWEFVFSGKVVLTYHGETSCVEICSPDGRQEFDSKLREWRNLQIQLNAENSTSLGEKILFTYIG